MKIINQDTEIAFNAEKEFLESEYYKKYENTAFDGTGKNKVSYANYETAYSKIVEVMRDFFTLYYEKANNCNEKIGKELLKKIYRDPDQDFGKIINGVECSGDALISLSRLIGFSKVFNSEIVDKYKEYRRSVIFYFPKHAGGINQTRNFIYQKGEVKCTFGDRIDCTLLDIKNYCESIRVKTNKNIVLIKAYKNDITDKWFKYFDYDFTKIIDFYNIKNIFTNDNYDIYMI